MSLLLSLFIRFFYVGLFSIGGGLATVPFLYQLADTMGWFTHSDVADMIAIAESTPGAIGVNMASFAGFNVDGILGGLFATLGLIAPSIIIILLISKVLEKYRDNKYVNALFFGLRPASIAMIAAALFNVVEIALINIDKFMTTYNIFDLFVFKAILLAVILYLIQKKTNCHPIVLILISAIVGVIFQFGV